MTDAGQIQVQLIELLNKIIEGDIGEYYDTDGKPKPLHELTREQRILIQELFQGVHPKLMDKMKAIQSLIAITGLQKTTQLFGVDEESTKGLDLKIEFVSKSSDTNQASLVTPK